MSPLNRKAGERRLVDEIPVIRFAKGERKLEVMRPTDQTLHDLPMPTRLAGIDLDHQTRPVTGYRNPTTHAPTALLVLPDHIIRLIDRDYETLHINTQAPFHDLAAAQTTFCRSSFRKRLALTHRT